MSLDPCTCCNNIYNKNNGCCAPISYWSSSQNTRIASDNFAKLNSISNSIENKNFLQQNAIKIMNENTNYYNNNFNCSIKK